MKAIVNRSFKYNGEVLEPGDEFVPIGGKFDHILMDPTKHYVKLVEEPEYPCNYCERTFDTPQGKAAHTRFCDKKE